MRVSLAVTSLFVLSSLAHGKGFHSMPMEKSSQEGSCCTSLSRGGGGSSSEPLRFVFFFECFGDEDAILSLFCSFFYCMSEASSNSQWNIISILFSFQTFDFLTFDLKVCLHSARRALKSNFITLLKAEPDSRNPKLLEKMLLTAFSTNFWQNYL